MRCLIIIIIYMIFLLIYLMIFGFQPIKTIRKILSKKIEEKLFTKDPLEIASFYVFLIIVLLIGIGIFYNYTYKLNSDILAYSGSIIGSGFGLLGIFMTIYFTNENRKKDQRLHDKERREELELMYQPILSAKIINYKKTDKLCNEITLRFNHNEFDDSTLNAAPYMIEFTNTGRGEIKDYSLQMENCSIISSPFNNKNELDLSKSYILGDGSFNFFPINGSNYTTINIPTPNILYLMTDTVRISVTLKIYITGFIQEVRHEYSLNFYITIPLNGKTEEIDIDSLTMSYIGKERIEKEIHSVG